VSLSAELKCRAAAAKLEKGKRNAASKLGPADPFVECLRTQSMDLRKRADNLHWNRLVAWHDHNIAEALRDVEDGAGVGPLEAAVALAHSSEVGPAHRIVIEGRRNVLRWRKHRRREGLERVEGHLKFQLAEAVEMGDLHVLAAVIDEAARAIGSSHPAVEAARGEMRSQRRDWQQERWGDLNNEHNALMMQACASNSIEQISLRIWATANSELGVGHPSIEHGKDCIRNLKRNANQAQLEFYRQECMLMLNAPEVIDALVASELGQCPR